MSRGTILLWGAVVVLSCLFRGSGCRRHKCLFRSNSRVLWRHAGHLLDRFSLFPVLCTWSGEQRAWKPCATTCLCVADQPFLRKRLSSSSVDRDGWEEASHPGSTGSA